MSCPSPFVPRADYPALGGDINSRICLTLPVKGQPDCCLPCPRQDWVYPDDFRSLIRASTYVNLVGVGCCVMVLLSFACLPVEYTNRHYLSVCLVAAIMLLSMSFVIPLGMPNNQCYDFITPNDMYSSVSCALSGALLLGGGWCVAMWIFLRTLSLHLQICWQVVPGRRFFLTAQAVGWSVPVVFLAIALAFTGVSFRFGDSCHINTKDGLKTFWGPLLGITAASIVGQIITFGYCVKVYIRSLLDDANGNTTLDTPLPYATSLRTITPRQALRRVQRVIALQWRGIMVVIIIITDVVFFATVFLSFEKKAERTPENVFRGLEWILCLLENDGDKNKCLDMAARLVIPERTAVAVIFLLSCNGIWALLLLGRFSMAVGWWHMARDLFTKKPVTDEFVSYNARRSTEPESSYEMLESREAKGITTKVSQQTEAHKTLTQQSSLPKLYQPSKRSSGLSSSPSSPGIELAKSPQSADRPHFRKTEILSEEGDGFVHHGLSPKPPQASHWRGS